MQHDVQRDFVGYGESPPDLPPSGGAKIAVNFVSNYEEGFEPSIQERDGWTENGLTGTAWPNGREGRPRPRGRIHAQVP